VSAGSACSDPPPSPSPLSLSLDFLLPRTTSFPCMCHVVLRLILDLPLPHFRGLRPPSPSLSCHLGSCPRPLSSSSPFSCTQCWLPPTSASPSPSHSHHLRVRAASSLPAPSEQLEHSLDPSGPFPSLTCAILAFRCLSSPSSPLPALSHPLEPPSNTSSPSPLSPQHQQICQT
jgi:hypothetical protein